MGRVATVGPCLELLLFLSALLSGLTGVISGERAAAPSSLERGSAQVAVIAEELAEATVRAPVARFAASAPALLPSRPYVAIRTAPSLDPLRISESRLE